VWGIVPAAGIGSRIQPLAFSKELLPVGSVRDGSTERPRAVSEYLVERLVLGGATRICFVISPEKADIISYFGAGTRDAQLCYVVQPDAGGLCDAIFRALPLVRDDEHVLVGLPDTRRRSLRLRGGAMSVEAVMLWNEPNNLSHWDFTMDPGWTTFAAMAKLAARAIHAERPKLPRVLGGISPIDPAFLNNLKSQGVLDELDVVAVHGFPLDWNHWQIHEWPNKLAEIREVTDKPLWVSEVGVSTFGAEEVQEFGLRRTAELLSGRAPRIHWYSLYDLPRAWPATTRHREAEGSSYYRHFYMGLLREDGTPKRALRHFADYTPELGICQWFHFEDHRLDDAVRWLARLGVKRVRTGLSWADSHRPNADVWFDRQMKALDRFDTTITFCFTPGSAGQRDDHTSPPQRIEEFAEFCSRMTRRYC
jgi:beta-xylosidase